MSLFILMLKNTSLTPSYIYSQVQTNELQPSLHLPPTFKSPSPSPELDKLTELLGQLNERHYFFVEGGPDKDGCVAYFLVGQLSQSDAKGWVGLVGMGVWS